MNKKFLLLFSALYCTHSLKAELFIQVPDPILSEKTQKRLFSLISNGLSQKKSLKTVLEAAQKELPSIHTLLIKKNSIKKRSSVHIKHEYPWLRVICENYEPSIISRAGDFIPASCYRPDVIEYLPTIMMLTPTESSSLAEQKNLLFLWARTQPLQFFERFAVSWTTPYTLSLYDTKNPSILLIASTKTKFDQKTDQLLDKLYQHIAQKEIALSQNKTTLWTVDLRFKGQLVLSHKPSKKDAK